MNAIRVLYVEDSAADRELTRRHLTRHAPHIELTEAATIEEALERLEVGDVDLVVSDYRLPDGTGLNLLETIRAKGLPVPVIMVTGSGDVDAAVRLLKAGAADYLVKTGDHVAALPQAIEAAHRWFQSAQELRRTPVRVLYAEHDAADIELTERAFRDHAPHFRLELAPTGQAALRRLQAEAFDLLLLDYRLPDMTGIELLKAMREGRLAIPVVMVTGQGDEDTAVQAFKLGVADYVVKGEGYLTRLPPTAEHVLAQSRLAAEKEALVILNRLAKSISRLQDTGRLREVVVQAACDLLKVDEAILWLAGEDGDFAPATWVGRQTAPRERVPAAVVNQWLDDEGTRRLVSLATLAAGIPGSRPAFAEQARAVSLVSPSGVIGVLGVASRLPRIFTAVDDRLLVALADHTAVALENVRLYADITVARDFLQSIAANSADGIVTTDVHGAITYFSPGAETILGYRAGEVVGRQAAEFYRAGRDEAREVMARLLAERSLGHETTLRARDGRWVDVHAAVALLRDAAGAVTGTVAVVRDVTERRRTEAALRQSEKLAAMGSLLAGVAHELNNPLSVVMAHCTLLQRGAEGAAAERADKMLKAAERCARIVRNFLALARQHPPARDIVALHQTIDEAVELLVYGLRTDNVEVVLDFDRAVPPLWADPHQLHQVLVNLITNAAQAMKTTPPPRRLTIRTRFRADARTVTVEVADSGPGIPPDLQGRIFEPFFTTKAAGEGTGLGLSLCRGIVESHGGTIAVESRPGEGAVFRVTLPVTERHRDALASSPAPPHPAGAKRVLVVDDEDAVAEVLADVLRAVGYQVDIAGNGAMALSRLRQQAYDVVVTDIKMPELDGPGLYRALERLAHPVLGRLVFMTGDELSQQTRDFLELSRARYVTKPFTLDEVERIVAEAAEAT